jgi:hypothetical protein
MHIRSLDFWHEVGPGEVTFQGLTPEHYTHRCGGCRRYKPVGQACAHCSQIWWDLDGDSPGWGETIEYDQWKEGRLHIDARKLEKRLKEQGFTIEKTKNGWQVKAPNGGLHTIHTGSLDRHAVLIIKELERLGFRSDHDAWRREQQKEKELARRKEEAREKERKEEEIAVAAPPPEHTEPWLVGDTWHCHLCDFTHTYKPSMFIHASKTHGWKRDKAAIDADRKATEARANAKRRGKPAPAIPEPRMSRTTGRPAATPVKRSVLPDEELTELAKVRKLAHRIEKGSALMTEAARALVEKFEAQDNELKELKAKQAKLEKKIAGIVDAL